MSVSLGPYRHLPESSAGKRNSRCCCPGKLAPALNRSSLDPPIWQNDEEGGKDAHCMAGWGLLAAVIPFLTLCLVELSVDGVAGYGTYTRNYLIWGGLGLRLEEPLSGAS